VKPFEGAPFQSAIEPGLDAISEKEYRTRISVVGRAGKDSLSFSVDIDAAMCDVYPDSPRWDYGVWYGSERLKVAFIEVHKAESGQVDLILRKRQWLKDILVKTKLPSSIWWWLATGKNKIPPQSSQMRRLHLAGIRLEAKNIILN
jgi:hypothetical protein